MVSTFTPSLNLEVPASGDYVNSWQLPANSNYNAIDSGIGGIASITLTTGTVNLTQAQANCAILTLNGSLTGNVNIIYPTSSAGRKLVVLNAALNGHIIQIRGNAGGDAIGIFLSTGPFSAPVIAFIVTPGRVYWDYTGSAGPGSVALFPNTFRPNGWIACDGSLISTTQFDLLFAVLGYGFGGSGASFAVPDYRGYAMVGSDNMGSGSAGRFFNFGPGATTGATAAAPPLPAHTHPIVDPGHLHIASEAPHSHGGVITGFSAGGNFAAGAGWALTSGNTATAQPAITVNSAATGISATGSAGAGGTVPIVQPSRTVNAYIKW